MGIKTLVVLVVLNQFSDTDVGTDGTVLRENDFTAGISAKFHREFPNKMFGVSRVV